MKKNGIAVPAAIVFAASAVAAFGVTSFIGPCVHDDGSFGACHWAGQALLGIFCLLALEGLICAAWNENRVRGGLYLAMLLTAIMGFFIPGTLIGLCSMDTMRCRAIMKPAATILLAFDGLLSLAGLVTELRRGTSRYR